MESNVYLFNEKASQLDITLELEELSEESIRLCSLGQDMSHNRPDQQNFTSHLFISLEDKIRKIFFLHNKAMDKVNITKSAGGISNV